VSKVLAGEGAAPQPSAGISSADAARATGRAWQREMERAQAQDWFHAALGGSRHGPGERLDEPGAPQQRRTAAPGAVAAQWPAPQAPEGSVPREHSPHRPGLVSAAQSDEGSAAPEREMAEPDAPDGGCTASGGGQVGQGIPQSPAVPSTETSAEFFLNTTRSFSTGQVQQVGALAGPTSAIPTPIHLASTQAPLAAVAAIPAPAPASDSPERARNVARVPNPVEPAGLRERPPVRIHMSGDDKGLRIWLGVDGDAVLVQSRAGQVLAELRRLLGEAIWSNAAVVCNGQPLAITAQQPPQEADGAALPTLLQRSPHGHRVD
jgi:hypothetical protein